MANKTADAADTLTLDSIAAPLAGSANAIPNGKEGIDAIADLVRSASEIRIVAIPTDGFGPGLPEKIPVVIDHRKDGAISSLKSVVDQHRLEPARHVGTAHTTTLQSFIDLIDRHKNEGSAVFAKTSWPSPSLTAVIDYHGIDHTPRWGKHRIAYEFPVTDEFKVWIEKNGKPMEQAAFAAFLEDHAAELSAAFPPEEIEYETLFKEKFATPADLIALSRNLEVHVNAKVKQGLRIQTGERVVEFVEEHMNGKGEKVEIPGIFMVSVPAFVDGENVRIPARLRYRIANGEIHWFYQLYRWQHWLRDQVKNDLDTVKHKTLLPTFEGSPEAA